MKVTNQVNPNPDQIREFFGSLEDGPFVMVNLLKFRDKAEYSDQPETDRTGRQAYDLYAQAVQKCLANVGARSIYAGSVTALMIGEVDENWDMVALAEYPSLEAFRAMAMSKEYQKIAVHRTAGLAGQLNIKTEALSPG